MLSRNRCKGELCLVLIYANGCNKLTHLEVLALSPKVIFELFCSAFITN